MVIIQTYLLHSTHAWPGGDSREKCSADLSTSSSSVWKHEHIPQLCTNTSLSGILPKPCRAYELQRRTLALVGGVGVTGRLVTVNRGRQGDMKACKGSEGRIPPSWNHTRKVRELERGYKVIKCICTLVCGHMHTQKIGNG